MLISDVGEGDKANFPFSLQLGKSLHGGVKRHDRIGRMELVNVDSIETQSL